MLIDSHCHLDRLDLKPFGRDFSAFVAEARRQGIGHMLCVSIDLENFPSMRELVEPFEEISISVGVHPNETDCEEPTVERLVELAAHPKVVAIGETGLDYYRTERGMEWQHERLRRHVAAARATGKPLIVHMRNATEDTLRILRDSGADGIGGVFHCFAEDWEVAQRALDLGFYISFSGIVTFKSALSIQEAAQKIPADRYLVETDSPYLAPVPHRGKPNYPYYVRQVAQFIAQLRGVSEGTVVEQTGRNFRDLFLGGKPLLSAQAEQAISTA